MVKNYIVSNLDEVVDEVIKKLIKENIKFCEIKYELYTEIHTEEVIYRLYSFNKLKYNKSIEVDNMLIKKLTDFTPKKDKTGYKKYTKKLIKKDNKKSKVNTKKIK